MLTMQLRGRQGLLLLACVLVLAALFSGCGIFSPDESKDDGGGGNTEPYPLATTPDVLISNFQRCYNERNFSEYDNLLHSDFQFYFSQEDVDLPAAAGGIWDRARDYSSTQNMFTGQAGVDETGAPQAPIQKIQLILTAVGVWSDQVPEERAGTIWREYNVEMQVDYTDGNGASVRGFQRFYAAAVPLELGDGTTVTIYKLKFWEDLGVPQV